MLERECISIFERPENIKLSECEQIYYVYFKACDLDLIQNFEKI